MKRLLSTVLILGLFAACDSGEAPQTESSAAAGYTVSVSQIVEHPSLDAVRQGFMDSLAEQGIAAEYNVHIAQGNIATANQIASQIKGEAPDLVLAIATPTAQACAQKIDSIPILITAITDPVAAGLVESLEAPGGNITGMTDRSPVDRQIALIREIVPNLETLGFMYNAGEANSITTRGQVLEVAESMGVKIEEATVANSAGVFQAAKSLVGRCDAIYIPTDNTVVSVLETVIKVCEENDLPLFAADTDSVRRGVIAAVAVDYYRMGRQTGVMAKRILIDDANPATMPVEDLQDLKLFVNSSAAERMGVTLPSDLLSRADEIIQ